MGRRLQANVVLAHPKTGIATPLYAGKEVPKWAEALITNEAVYVAEGDDSDDEPDEVEDLVGLTEEKYLERTAKELVAEIERRNEGRDEGDQIDVNLKSAKPLLAEALVADDDAHADSEG